MFAIKPNARMVTFNRNVIRQNWRRMNDGPLAKAGMLVRRIARGSIRRGNRGRKSVADGGIPSRWKRKPSQAPRPPKAWAEGNSGLKLIFSVPNSLGTSVMVGPIGFGGSNGSPVPALMEYGGTARREVWVKGNQRRTKTGRFGKRKMVRRTKTVRYEARPFMNPALMKGRSKMPHLWKGSFSPY